MLLILQEKDVYMNTLLLFLRILLFVVLILVLISAGFRILSISIRFWYISIPVLALFYLLISNWWKNRRERKEFLNTPFHPHQEVKPDREPEVTDENNSVTKEKNKNEKKDN